MMRHIRRGEEEGTYRLSIARDPVVLDGNEEEGRSFDQFHPHKIHHSEIEKDAEE